MPVAHYQQDQQIFMREQNIRMFCLQSISVPSGPDINCTIKRPVQLSEAIYEIVNFATQTLRKM